MTSSAVAIAPSIRLNQEAMERRFYLLAGCVFLVFVALGFQRFYLHGETFIHGPITPQIARLVIVHGIGMSVWILFFITQASLIVRGNRKLHMSMGVGGAVLAAFLVVVGMMTGIGSVHYRPHDFRDIGGAHRFLVIPVADIGGFGVLIAIGLSNRRRPEIHRPMMCLATLFAMTAAVFRIGFLRGPSLAAVRGTNFAVSAPWLPMLALGLLLLLVKWLMTRSWDRYFTLGWAGIASACVLLAFVSNTAAWDHFASWLTG